MPEDPGFPYDLARNRGVWERDQQRLNFVEFDVPQATARDCCCHWNIPVSVKKFGCLVLRVLVFHRLQSADDDVGSFTILRHSIQVDCLDNIFDAEIFG